MKHISIILGVLLPTFILADELYTSDIIGGCGDVYNYTAIFEPIVYTCASGYYLPAGAISCQACPETHNCPGGTFTFDANHTQGLEYGDILVTDAIDSCSSEFTQNFAAVFEPIIYDCDSGYYLPADGVECTICPENTVCSGGIYTYSENAPQGITGCTTGYNLNNNVCVANSIDITWNSGNDSESTTTQCTYDGDIILPTPPEKVGYTFIGWKLIADDSSD